MFLQGHAPYCSGRELAAYLIGGPVSDHESVNADEVRGKLRAGMHVNLRASSLIDNLSFLVDGCKDQPWRDFVSVCTDDVHAKDLLTVGHINNVVRKAVASGLDGREVVKMATLNAAREYGFNDLGAIAPATSPICSWSTRSTAAGRRPCSPRACSSRRTASISAVTAKRLTMTCRTRSICRRSQGRNPSCCACLRATPATRSASTSWCPRTATASCATSSRWSCRCVTARSTSAAIRRSCSSAAPTATGAAARRSPSIATSGSSAARSRLPSRHDSHNFTVSYHDPKDAFRAAEILRACGGGVCVIDGAEETHIALPAAGLMSQKPCAEVADEIAAVQAALDAISSGRLTLLATAVMALPVLPSVVITDMGLVNGATQTFVPVFADAEA